MIFRSLLLLGASVAALQAATSGAATLAGTEPRVLVLDFTDNAFAPTGHYGSAYIRNDSGAEILAGAEPEILVLDFTDATFAADTSQYGSAYWRF